MGKQRNPARSVTGCRQDSDNGSLEVSNILTLFDQSGIMSYMRDELFRTVPLPSDVRRWVRCASREADQLSGRSRDALCSTLLSTFRREVSKPVQNLLRGILAESDDLSPRLPGMDLVRFPRLTGGPLETDLVSNLNRLLDAGHPRQEAVRLSVEHALRGRAESWTRECEASTSHVDRTGARGRCVEQMRKDSEAVDCSGVMRGVLARGPQLPRLQPTPSLDEDLLAGNSIH